MKTTIKWGRNGRAIKKEITKIITYQETATKKTCTSIAYTLYLTFRITPNIHILLIMAIIDILFIWFLSQKQWQTLSKSLRHTMGKIKEWEYQNERKLKESILYTTADVFTFDLHVGCTEHTRVEISSMQYVCSCDTQCIQSSTCLIQKYPVSYVTLGHCAVFAHVCMHACFQTLC